MLPPTLKDRFAGVVFGTAIGDALGYPVEFYTQADLDAQYPEGVVDFIHLEPLYSDDTQMFRATLEGLLRTRYPWDLDKAAEEIAEEYVAWSESPENNRAPGASCMYGCRQLSYDVPWRQAGKPHGKGCGTAMRSMAYGLWFWQDPQQAAVYAGEHALMTHLHPVAQAAAAAVAAGVATAVCGYSIADIADVMVKAAGMYDRNTADMLLHAERLALRFLSCGDTEEVARPRAVLDKWRGWTGDEAVAAALYCFLRTPDNYKATVLTAINSPGDSDSLGAIAGALSGAHLGVQAIPANWKQQIEKAEELAAYPDRIFRAREYDKEAL